MDVADDVEVALSREQWQRLVAAQAAYTATVSPHYDEVLHQVTERAVRDGSLGKAEIGALLLWKRLRGDTPWAGELMALPDTDVRRATGAAVTAVRNTFLGRGAAARAGRAALGGLPGFRSGDALASAVLTAAAPARMAVYDRRAHTGLRRLGITLTDTPGRYGRYIGIIDRLLATAPDPVRTWTPREVDTALYFLARDADD
ncbi:hypothetical protein ACF1AY_09335 [Streptomyces sp. NPDC014776]|uniref:hypothetical protein n=1 Tax=unclassified Streptomyces TaxID=2593676 RepID=UPI0036FCEB30